MLRLRVASVLLVMAVAHCLPVQQSAEQDNFVPPPQPQILLPAAPIPGEKRLSPSIDVKRLHVVKKQPCVRTIENLCDRDFSYIYEFDLLPEKVVSGDHVKRLEFLNKTTVYNKEALQRAVCRPPGVPLLTVSNHHSCFDDPGLWGVLDCVTLVRGSRMRWSLAAHDICFTNALHSYFFALGKCVPVVRGAGVYQPAIDFCVERLERGEWVHIFPEGRVNVDKEHIRFKWGVGRLVAACAAPPLIVPVWHEGLDRVLPNQEPYLLKFRKRVFLNVGEPIQIDHLLDRLRKSNASEEETRKAITDRIQDELLRLRESTHALIRRALGAAADSLLERPAPEPTPAPLPAARLANGTVRDKDKEL